MLYNIHELIHASLSPLKFAAIATKTVLRNPLNPFSHTNGGRTMAAMSELIERTTKRFGKPSFGLDHTIIDGKRVSVTEHNVDERPFCNLIKFHRSCKRNDPKVLVIAPLSGHYATLLRGTVEALLPHHDVYITDWMDARQVAMTEGKFDLDDCIAYIMNYIRLIGDDCHVVAVCQPAVPVLAAVSLLASMNDPKQPVSMTLMGGPIDPRVSKTEVTELAENKPIEWFERNVVSTVPAYYPGAFRKVYPGFVQLSGFMSMNLERHIGSHMDFYNHLVEGDGESAERHRVFYDEYLAVMDLTSEFYLQTVETVFQKHSLATGDMIWVDPITSKTHKVDPSAIKRTALLTVEGELDDISAMGQTEAAHKLCSSLDLSKKYHHVQKNVGHYGIFNGRRWREQIMPRLRQFMRQNDPESKALSQYTASEAESAHDVTPSLWKTEKIVKKPSLKTKKKSTTKKASVKKANSKTAGTVKTEPKTKKKSATKKVTKKKTTKKQKTNLKLVSSK